jgi:hypothetical protein
MSIMTNLLTIHVKKITIQTKNMQLLNNLRHNMTRFNKLFIIFYRQILNEDKLRTSFKQS